MKTQANNTVGRRNFGQTMREGARVLGGKDVANYSLYFHTATKDRRAGDHMVVVVPYIEIGRGSGCQVQFGDDQPQVSRQHAAIRWDNGRVMVKHLSATNSTIVRRFPQGSVETLSMSGQEVEITNGDQLQLSSDGPIIAFNATETKTSNIGFTQRLQLFSQQALKPYKTAVGALALVLVMSVGGLTYLNSALSGKLDVADEKIVNMQGQLALAQEDAIAAQKKLEKVENDANSTQEQIIRARRDLVIAHENTKKIQVELDAIKNGTVIIDPPLPPAGPVSPPPPPPGPFTASKYKSSIYYVQVENFTATHPETGTTVIPLSKELKMAWSGTGFLTTDGRLITARHVIQGWRFIKDCSDMVLPNFMETTGGKLTVKYVAYSPGGDRFSFSLDNVRKNDSDDAISSTMCPELGDVRIARDFGSDWAYVNLVNRKGNIRVNPNLSSRLSQQEELHVMGYSYGAMLQDGEKGLDPIYSKCIVGQSGLNKGMINLTSVSYGSGCSGGPVFAIRNGQAYAVGIVSNSIGSTSGQIVPISNINL